MPELVNHISSTAMKAMKDAIFMAIHCGFLAEVIIKPPRNFKILAHRSAFFLAAKKLQNVLYLEVVRLNIFTRNLKLVLHQCDSYKF